MRRYCPDAAAGVPTWSPALAAFFDHHLRGGDGSAYHAAAPYLSSPGRVAYFVGGEHPDACARVPPTATVEAWALSSGGDAGGWRQTVPAGTNHSVSSRGVLRGVHFTTTPPGQVTTTPPGQAKFVYCAAGLALDVVVDLRVGSPTFGRWDCVTLDDLDFRAVYLPVGVGHAFLALRDATVTSYLLSTAYRAELEMSIDALDPDLALPWPGDLEFVHLLAPEPVRRRRGPRSSAPCCWPGPTRQRRARRRRPARVLPRTCARTSLSASLPAAIPAGRSGRRIRRSCSRGAGTGHGSRREGTGHAARPRSRPLRRPDVGCAGAALRSWALGQVGQPLRTDNVVNMDVRTVLFCLPMPDDAADAPHTNVELESLLAGQRPTRLAGAQRISLRTTLGWVQHRDVSERPDGRFFDVVGVRVDAPDREVGGWSQPLLEPTRHGFVALFVRRFSGVPRPLVAARAEAGFAGRRVNVQARSLLAALVTGAVEI